MCLQRVNAVHKLLELLGPEDPVQARTKDLHFWRASYGTDRLHNGIYGSSFYRNCSCYLFTLLGLSAVTHMCGYVCQIQSPFISRHMNLGNIRSLCRVAEIHKDYSRRVTDLDSCISRVNNEESIYLLMNNIQSVLW